MNNVKNYKNFIDLINENNNSNIDFKYTYNNNEIIIDGFIGNNKIGSLIVFKTINYTPLRNFIHKDDIKKYFENDKILVLDWIKTSKNNIGYGKILLKELFNYLNKSDYDYIFLIAYSLTNNLEKLVNFYLSNGFKILENNLNTDNVDYKLFYYKK